MRSIPPLSVEDFSIFFTTTSSSNASETSSGGVARTSLYTRLRCFSSAGRSFSSTDMNRAVWVCREFFRRPLLRTFSSVAEMVMRKDEDTMEMREEEKDNSSPDDLRGSEERA